MQNIIKLCSLLLFVLGIIIIFNSDSYSQELNSNSGKEVVFSVMNDNPKPGGEPINAEVETEIHYDGANTSGVGAASSTFIIAARFTTTQTGGHIGEYIKKVRVFIQSPTAGNAATVRIYGAGTSTTPGALVYSQAFTTVSNSWNEVVLNTPVLVPNADIWVGVEATALAAPDQFWGGTDAGPNNIDGQWIYFGGAWARLTALNAALTYNWNIRAVVDNLLGPGQATNPTPLNGATGINISGLTLSWTNPPGATSNRVLFGTSVGTMSQLHTGSLVSSVSAPTPLNYYTIYYWQVNEIAAGDTTYGPVWAFLTVPNPAGVTLPYTQTFDGSIIPEHWTQTFSDGVTSNRWGISASSVAGGTPNEIVGVWVNQVGVSRLIVGPINTSGMSSLLLSFRQFFQDYDVGINYKIQSSSNATTWTDEAFQFSSGNGDVGPELVNTNIVNNVGGTTYIAWVLDGDHYQFDYWILDDVSISQQFTNDVSANSIDLKSVLPTGTFTPKAMVQNLGINTATFNVQMTITGGYSSTKNVSNLAPFAIAEVIFDDWTSNGGNYTVDVCTQLGGDQNPANNCQTKAVLVSEKWTHNSVYPTTTYLGSGVGYNSNTVFSIGGNTTSNNGTECFSYNVTTNTWTPIASLPQGRRVLATARVGDFIYAIGGSDMTSVYRASVYRYDINMNTWSVIDSLPVAVAWGKAVTYNNNIYLAGGVDGTGTIVSTVYMYNTTTNTWSAATSMPGEKFGGAFAISGDKLVYVGGADDDGITNTVYVGTIDGGNPLTVNWTTAASKYPGIKEGIFSGVYQKDFARLSDKSKKEKRNILNTDAVAYPPGTMYRFDGATWGSDGIIVAGGSPASSWIPSVPNPCYVYKPGSDTWTEQSQVPTAVLGSSLASVQNGSIWKLVVVSGLSNDVVNATQIFTDDLGGAPTTFQLSVNVIDGWNMVSVPGNHPANQNVNTWWPSRNPLADVYRWTGSYQSVLLTAPTQGYWMLHNGANTYNTGDEWPAGGIQIVAHDPISISNGWNMIGAYEQPVPVGSLTTTPPGLIVAGTIYGWNGSYFNAANLAPGYGYWVLVNGNGVINVPTVLDGGTVAKQEDRSSWGKIIITDAAKRSYTLFAIPVKSGNSSGVVNLDSYQLPPLPPAGSFDVRFSSQRVAEDLNSEQTIEMSGLVYPVTVAVENLSVRIKDESGKLINTKLGKGEELQIDNNLLNKLVVAADVIPASYSLEQNYPNPFNPSTNIEFSLPEDVENVKLIIYDALGQKVIELVNSKLEAGKYKYQWDARDAASGLYVYELRTTNYSAVKKMLLLK